MAHAISRGDEKSAADGPRFALSLLVISPSPVGDLLGEEVGDRMISESQPALGRSAWGRRSSGGAHEPGQKDPKSHIDKGELAWTFIGSGMIARTFPNSDRLVLTTGRGPKADEIDYRVVRDIVTGKVLH